MCWFWTFASKLSVSTVVSTPAFVIDSLKVLLNAAHHGTASAQFSRTTFLPASGDACAERGLDDAAPAARSAPVTARQPTIASRTTVRLRRGNARACDIWSLSFLRRSSYDDYRPTGLSQLSAPRAASAVAAASGPSGGAWRYAPCARSADCTWRTSTSRGRTPSFAASAAATPAACPVSQHCGTSRMNDCVDGSDARWRPGASRL